MYFIKIDADKNPVGHPLLSANLQEVLEVSYIDQELMDKYGYAKFQPVPIPENGAIANVEPEYRMGKDGIVRPFYEVVPFSQEELLDKFIRARRSYLLAQSDWTQSQDSPLSSSKKTEWATYRQALRDLTSTYPNVQTADEVVWPQQPE